MKKEIRITKKTHPKGDDGHKTISVRMKEETVAKLEALSVRTNRSRNELINILLEAAVDIVEVEEV